MALFRFGRYGLLALTLVSCSGLGGCATARREAPQPAAAHPAAETPSTTPSAPPLAPVPRDHWSGRLAMQVHAEPTPQSFFTNFDLQGNASQGELQLFTPLGTTLAQIRWSPDAVVLQDSRGSHGFHSVEDLLEKATGAAIPLAALFDWLAGKPTAIDGWQPDTTQWTAGRRVATRLQPLPTVTLRLALDP